MATSRPFAYNPSPNPPIDGTLQVGDIAVGVDPSLDYYGGVGGVQWWQGPDEDLGYIVAKPVPSLNQPNPLNIPAGVAFGRSLFTEQSFIALAESLSSGTTFSTGNEASTWLTNNGYWNTWVFITPTQTPTNTPTPTITSTPSVTPSNTPSSTPPPITPSNTPQAQYYFFEPNSWAPPTVNQGGGDNFLYTTNPLSTIITTSDIDYTTTNWSFSVWALPQFEYKSLPTTDILSSQLISLSVPNSNYPDQSLTSLTIAVEYSTSGSTLINDLVVYMLDDLGRSAKWSWSINIDTNSSITGVIPSVMWDYGNPGSTLNANNFSNIVITHDNSLVIPNVSGSTLAYWNGSQLTLKSYTEVGGIYPHISDYNSLVNTTLYLSIGNFVDMTVSLHPLSCNIDNPTYYPLTTLSSSDASSLYGGGVVSPSIIGAATNAYIWNFDNISANHLECLDKNNTTISDFVLSEQSGGGGTINYVLI